MRLDGVASVGGAGEVIAGLHSEKKRLLLVDSRRRAEGLGTDLRGHGVTTFLSRPSLSAVDRRRSKEVFAESSLGREAVAGLDSQLQRAVLSPATQSS